MGTFYAFPYYITPGQYVYNGLITSIYKDNNSTVVANTNTAFYKYLNETGNCNAVDVCTGTASDYIQVFFGGNFVSSDNPHLENALVLGLFLCAARVFTWIALKYIRFS